MADSDVRSRESERMRFRREWSGASEVDLIPQEASMISGPPSLSPEPKTSLTIPQILAKALVSVIDRSRGLPRGMEIIRTIRPGR